MQELFSELIRRISMSGSRNGKVSGHLDSTCTARPLLKSSKLNVQSLMRVGERSPPATHPAYTAENVAFRCHLEDKGYTRTRE